SVLIKNASTGLCADLPNFAKGKSDGPVNQYYCNGTNGDNQLWDLQVASGVTGPDAASVFVIRNVKDGLCMDLPNYGADSSGTAVEEFACDNTVADNQLWWLVPRSDGTYWIRDYISGMCLDVTGGATAGHDARLVQSKCSDDVQDAGHWRLA
ncbi:MAG: hypothetical protein QOF98_3311, partial [Streptomyces sp.]|nr:hypothetical protein [Streptomyces sp.]